MLKRNGQVASRDDQLNSIRFRAEVVSKQIYLMQYGLMAERHWREFRPKMVRFHPSPKTCSKPHPTPRATGNLLGASVTRSEGPCEGAARS
jgi:hypothetical protein